MTAKLAIFEGQQGGGWSHPHKQPAETLHACKKRETGADFQSNRRSSGECRLKWLTVSLFAYFGTVMVVHIPWQEVARGLFIPTVPTSSTFWTSVVAILGTTISPYLFFWQASQEVEDVEATPIREPLKYAPHQAESALQRNTYFGMAFSNLVAVAIIVHRWQDSCPPLAQYRASRILARSAILGFASQQDDFRTQI
jgi:hypothetical protein